MCRQPVSGGVWYDFTGEWRTQSDYLGGTIKLLSIKSWCFNLFSRTIHITCRTMFHWRKSCGAKLTLPYPHVSFKHSEHVGKHLWYYCHVYWRVRDQGLDWLPSGQAGLGCVLKGTRQLSPLLALLPVSRFFPDTPSKLRLETSRHVWHSEGILWSRWPAAKHFSAGTHESCSLR